MNKLKHYMLNARGEEWIWEAENEEQATLIFLSDFYCNKTFKSLEKALKQYEKDAESVGFAKKIEWKEYEKIFTIHSENENDFRWSAVK